MNETPESRGSQNVPNRLSYPTQVSTQNQNNTRNYSQATQKTPTAKFPKREQAIILNAVDELKLADYVVAVGKIIGPRNITFASRISNNRICLYFSSVQVVEKFVSENSTINVQGKQINVRKLINPARRIIISNVTPGIPHEVLENVLAGIGLKLVSSVTFMRAGIPGDENIHILSFRRQVYIQPEETVDLPSSLFLKLGGTSYRIYRTADDMSCFLCKQPGHVAKKTSQSNDQTPQE